MWLGMGGQRGTVEAQTGRNSGQGMGDSLELHPSFRIPRRCALNMKRPSCSFLSLSPTEFLVNRVDILLKALSRAWGAPCQAATGQGISVGSCVEQNRVLGEGRWGFVSSGLP